jgi:hypothetical protein
VNDAEVRARLKRLEGLLERAEQLPAAVDAIREIVELYGEALRRVVEAGAVPASVYDDELVSHLLVLHDLHPRSLEERVTAALDQLIAALGPVEVAGLDGAVLHVRVPPSGGCGGSAHSRAQAISDAVLRAAPELERVEVDDAPPVLQLRRRTRPAVTAS